MVYKIDRFVPFLSELPFDSHQLKRDESRPSFPNTFYILFVSFHLFLVAILDALLFVLILLLLSQYRTVSFFLLYITCFERVSHFQYALSFV